MDSLQNIQKVIATNPLTALILLIVIVILILLITKRKEFFDAKMWDPREDELVYGEHNFTGGMTSDSFLKDQKYEGKADQGKFYIDTPFKPEGIEEM
jgi:hypothetical protein